MRQEIEFPALGVRGDFLVPSLPILFRLPAKNLSNFFTGEAFDFWLQRVPSPRALRFS
jgi:hypothetical protein